MAATKKIEPTVKPRDPPIVVQEGEAIQKEEGGIVIQPGGALPPITHIKPPDMKLTSTKIRWYLGLGYEVKIVSDFLGVRYQQVRNVGVQTPKRAAREDVPPYVLELWEVDDNLEAMDKFAMEQQMAAQRDDDRRARKGRNSGVPQDADNGEDNGND